ncbi:MAG: hypothetical protein U0M66_02915 [Bacilli bacterium]|nr:hypothetical protein [Bacilli bacterium]
MAYVDLVVLIVMLVFVIIYSKRFQTYIFGFGMIDILFRILNIINGFIPIKEVRTFINEYVPESVPGVINHYTSGIFNTVLIWVYVVIMAIFLYFIVKLFVKRKKI